MTSINDGGPAVEVPLLDGGVCLVSPQDAQMVLSNQWRTGTNGYVYRRNGRRPGVTSLLHRIILNAKSDQEVHHCNEDKCDNRRENLELTASGRHQREHHSEQIADRNRARRKHTTHAICPVCGIRFEKNPDHRDRQKVCSKACAIAHAVCVRQGAKL